MISLVGTNKQKVKKPKHDFYHVSEMHLKQIPR